MYSLISQSVMWRPGEMRFLIGMKNPLHIRPTASFPGGQAISKISAVRSHLIALRTAAKLHVPADYFSGNQVSGNQAEATSGGLETVVVSRGTESSNPASSTGESADHRSFARDSGTTEHCG